jgi:hypothetical protein
MRTLGTSAQGTCYMLEFLRQPGKLSFTVTCFFMRNCRCALNRAPVLAVEGLLLCLAPVLGCLGEDQEGTPALPRGTNAGPHITVVERAFDFGTVLCGEVIKHDFSFTNTGAQLLVIKDVQTTCGCATARNWSHEVPPGKAGVIPIEFQTVNFSGRVAKSVTVTCNDPDQGTVALEIKGSVWRPIELIPQAAIFAGHFDSLSNICRSIRIVNHDGQPLTLSAPVSSHPAIQTELHTNKPGTEYQLLVRLEGPLGAGNLFGEVSLKTSNPQVPVLKVSVFSLACPGVMVLPTELEVPGSPTTSNLTRTVSIRNNSSNPLKLSDPTINAKGVDLNLQELRPGQFFSIVLTFPEGFQSVKGERLELTVKSDNPQFTLLKVPILAR